MRTRSFFQKTSGAITDIAKFIQAHRDQITVNALANTAEVISLPTDTRLALLQAAFPEAATVAQNILRDIHGGKVKSGWSFNNRMEKLDQLLGGRTAANSMLDLASGRVGNAQELFSSVVEANRTPLVWTNAEYTTPSQRPIEKAPGIK